MYNRAKQGEIKDFSFNNIKDINNLLNTLCARALAHVFLITKKAFLRYCVMDTNQQHIPATPLSGGEDPTTLPMGSLPSFEGGKISFVSDLLIDTFIQCGTRIQTLQKQSDIKDRIIQELKRKVLTIEAKYRVILGPEFKGSRWVISQKIAEFISTYSINPSLTIGNLISWVKETVDEEDTTWQGMKIIGIPAYKNNEFLLFLLEESEESESTIESFNLLLKQGRQIVPIDGRFDLEKMDNP